MTLTHNSLRCNYWSNHANWTRDDYPLSSVIFNQCRNPGGHRSRPWCFISANEWEYCNIKMCPLAPTYSAQYPLGSKFRINILQPLFRCTV